MLNTWRGLVLAAGIVAIPAFAQAECPPQESIDRYAQTTRDALVALDGLIPEEQQRDLEDRYVAMSILRWNWQGRDTILNEPSALDSISECINSGRCDAEASERSGAGPRTISAFPSDRLANWAKRQLECEVTASVVTETVLDPAPTDPEPAPAEEVVADTQTTNDTPQLPVEDPLPEPELIVESDPEPTDPIAEEPEILAEREIETDDVIVAEESTDQVDLDPASEPLDEEFEAADFEPVTETETETIAAPSTALSPTISTIDEAVHQRLIRSAAMSVMKGDVRSGIDSVSQACFLQAEQSDPVHACELVFDYYEHLAARADPIKFLAFTDELCRVEYARGCASLATYFGVTTTSEAHLAAVNFYDRACNSGDAEACAAASDYFLTGRASVANPARARDTLYRSCDLGRLASCQDLAEFFLRGVGGEADLSRALELNEVSCPAAQVSLPETCVAAANFVLLNLEAGPERAERVRTFTERACGIGHDVGCAWHADNLEYGIGGDVDLAGAQQARVTACQLGHRASCDANS